MQAVILAGGRGNRLKGMTDYIPKPLLPVEGKAVIGSIIESFFGAGISDIVLAIDYKADMIKYFVNQNNGFGANITYVANDDKITKNRGMLVGLYSVKEKIRGDFLLTACDTVFPQKYLDDLIKFHKACQNDATLSVSDLGKKELLIGRCCVTMSDDNSITRIVEKPSAEEVISTLVSTPLYALNNNVFDYVPKVTPSVRGEYELQSALGMMIDDGLAVRGFFNPVWNDLSNWKMLNDCSDFLRLNFNYTKELVELR